MEKSIVIALHGFLGLPQDWQSWHQTYAPHKKLSAINLWSDPRLNSGLSWNEWTESFLNLVRSYVYQKISVEVWGYSMGGRLALSAMTQSPEFFSRAVIISANPGIKNETARASRLQHDRQWATKFRTQEWSSLMQEWHQQPVLQEPASVDNSVYRLEKDYSRDQLAQALTKWSVAQQPNYWPRLSELQFPIDWHVGDYDQIYKAIGEEVCTLNSQIKLHVHPKRGHRLVL